MKGYNPKRVSKPEKREVKRKVLSVLNNAGRWVRVSSNIKFYSEHLNVVKSVQVNDHRIEYYNKDDRCVMVYEF